MSDPLLVVDGLEVRYPCPPRGVFTPRTYVRAVDGVSFTVDRGEILALVGESGCGKSTTARAVVRLVDPHAGCISFDDIDLAALPRRALRQQRQRIQMVFQDPYASLDPRLSAGAIVAEPLINFGLAHGRAAWDRACQLLEAVGLSAAQARRYPHEFSGGQRQRIGIARALAPQPDLLLCDEPVSALDVSVQAQIVNLLAHLRRDLGLAMVFIAHDLAVVRHLADRVAVMYRGRIVEEAPVDVLFSAPRHPYTRILLDAVPLPEAGAAIRAPRGEVTGALLGGCRFADRCPLRGAACAEVEPDLHTIADGHHVACCLAAGANAV